MRRKKYGVKDISYMRSGGQKWLDLGHATGMLLRRDREFPAAGGYFIQLFQLLDAADYGADAEADVAGEGLVIRLYDKRFLLLVVHEIVLHQIVAHPVKPPSVIEKAVVSGALIKIICHNINTIPEHFRMCHQIFISDSRIQFEHLHICGGNDSSHGPRLAGGNFQKPDGAGGGGERKITVVISIAVVSRAESDPLYDKKDMAGEIALINDHLIWTVFDYDPFFL